MSDTTITGPAPDSAAPANQRCRRDGYVVLSWTEEMDKALKAALALGLSFSQAANDIAERLGVPVTRNSCIGRAHRLGLKQQTPVPRIKRDRTPAGSIASGVLIGIRRIRREARLAKEGMFAPRSLRCEAIEPKHLTLLQLEAESCRWPYGGDGKPYTFCGHFSLIAPYCDVHHAAAVNTA